MISIGMRASLTRIRRGARSFEAVPRVMMIQRVFKMMLEMIVLRIMAVIRRRRNFFELKASWWGGF